MSARWFPAVWRRLPLELIVWVGGLIFLTASDPTSPSSFGFCLFQKMGIHFCPGCGLGRSVSFLLHGDVIRSWQTHPLGLPAALILFIRIGSLSIHLSQAARALRPDPSS